MTEKRCLPSFAVHLITELCPENLEDRLLKMAKDEFASSSNLIAPHLMASLIPGCSTRPTTAKKKRPLCCARSFWLPFAYQEAGESTEAELKDLAQQSIWQMETQIQQLRKSFGLSATSAPAAVTASAAPIPESALTPAQTISSLEALTQESDLLDEFADVL